MATLPLHIYQRQARMTITERNHIPESFGELTPGDLRTILDDARDGDTSDWIELCKHALKTDPHLFDLIDTRKKLVLDELDKYEIMPGQSIDADSQAMAGKAAEFCRTVISNIRPLRKKMSLVLDAIGQGFSATELLWGREHGANVITDFQWVHGRRFRWDDEWNLCLYDYGQRSGRGQYGEPLERDCWLVHVNCDEGVYPGEAGVLQHCIWPWLFKMWVGRYHIHAAETFGQPFVTATVPPNSDGTVRSSVLSKLEQLSYDTVGVFEEGTEVVFNGGPSTVNNGELFEKYLDRADKSQTKAVLGATDIVEQGKQGSLAAVESRTETTLDPRTASDIEMLLEDIAKQVFEPLVRHNLHLFNATDEIRVIPPFPRYKRKVAQSAYAVQGPTAIPSRQPAEPTQSTPATPAIAEKKTLNQRRSPTRTKTQPTSPHSTSPLARVLLGGSDD